MINDNKKIIALTTLLVFAFFAEAHEFWLEPLKFFLNPDENLVINFKVGESFKGEQWNLKKERLEKLELYQGAAVIDLKDKVNEGLKEHLQIPLSAEGTYMLVMKSDNAFSDLDADKFNDYLKEDGLDDALYHREKTNTLTKNGKEFYARNAKLLVQVGNKTDDTYKKSAGLPVEIIPQQNPYNLKLGDPIKFKILHEGKPVFTAKVKVFNRYNNRTTVQTIYSEKDGMIETHISNHGAWMVSFVKMVPSKNPEADWQSYWGSLVFGVK
jgi:uncharacterized GH25 family protein